MYPVKNQFLCRLIRAADPHHYDQILFTDPHRCPNNQLAGSLSEYCCFCERQGASRRFLAANYPQLAPCGSRFWSIRTNSRAKQTDQGGLRIRLGSLASSESQYCAVGGFYENRTRVGTNRSVWGDYNRDLAPRSVAREYKTRGLREKSHFLRSQTA